MQQKRLKSSEIASHKEINRKRLFLIKKPFIKFIFFHRRIASFVSFSEVWFMLTNVAQDCCVLAQEEPLDVAYFRSNRFYIFEVFD